VNAYTKIMTDASAEPLAVPAFLSRLSIEITPRQGDKIALLREKLAAGTRVFVALIDPADIDKQIEAVAALRKAGFEPVPHVPARFVRDRDDLVRRLGAFAAEAKVSQALVLGGGAPQPLGKYDAAIQLLETGLFEANGITRIGMAGHPEGNPDIIKARGEAMLMAALRAKQTYLAEKGLQGFIATHFM
jgi:methylenetetrahydrofolate reductase (NADPH)